MCRAQFPLIVYKISLVTAAVVITGTLFARDVPYLSGRVVDEAGLLSEDAVRQLEERLGAHENETSNQVVVLTIPSLEGEVIEQYSLKVAEAWQLGQSDKDNGALLLIARDDRKLRIEVGYGLEGALNDAVSARIIRNEIVPRFKDGEFEAGVNAGVGAMLAAIAGEYSADEQATGSTEEPAAEEGQSTVDTVIGWIGNVLAIVIGIVVILIAAGLGLGFVYYLFMVAVFGDGFSGWALFVILGPIVGMIGLLPVAFFDLPGYTVLPTLITIVSLMFVFKLWLSLTKTGREFRKKHEVKGDGGSSSSYSGSSYSSSSYSSSSYSSSSYSGGGGSFGGGGASGSW